MLCALCVTRDVWYLCGTYHTCPAGLLGVPQFGQDIEDQEGQESEGVPLNSASALHLAAWNTPANKDTRGDDLSVSGNDKVWTNLFHATVLCVKSTEHEH